MSLFNWYKPVKPELVSGVINGNTVKGELYRSPTPNGKGIVYCHGGFANVLTADIQCYVKAGYHLLHVDFENEGNLKESDPNRDIVETHDTSVLLQDKTGVTDIYLVGVSRGGYVALLTYAHHYMSFRKVVCYIGPINMFDPPYNWATWGAGHEGQVEDAKAYFGKHEDPYWLAKMGVYNGMGDRILLLYGEKDPICPYKIMGIPFRNKVGCKLFVFPKDGHNVHQDVNAQRIALSWLKI
jgi:dipeptidyl aminopeptidase/acylaminoacyl peptidase